MFVICHKHNFMIHHLTEFAAESIPDSIHRYKIDYLGIVY
jgi:hypothetical protein